MPCLKDWIVDQFGHSGVRSKCYEKKCKVYLGNLPPKFLIHGDNCSKKIHQGKEKPKSCDCIVVIQKTPDLQFLLIELKKNISSFDDSDEDFIGKMENSWKDLKCMVRSSGCQLKNLKCSCLFLVVARSWDPSFKKRLEKEEFYIDGVGPFRMITANNMCSLSKYIPEVYPMPI